MLRSRMFWNIFLGYGAVIVFAIALLGVVLDAQVEKNELQSAADRLLNEAIVVRESIGDPEPKNLRWIETLPKTVPTRVSIIAKDGRVLADSAQDASKLENHADRAEVFEAFRTGEGRAVRPSSTVGAEMMYVAVLSDRGYVVRVSMPLDSVRERLWHLHWLIAAAAAATAVLALGLAFWLARRTVQPVNDLTRGARQIAAGDYGHRVYSGGAGEVAQLAKSFNHMSERLAAQFAQIDEDRQQLRTVLSSMVEGVIAIDPDQKILFANDRAGQLLDFPSRTAVGRRLWELVRQRPLHDLIETSLNGGPNPLQSASLVRGDRSFLVQVAKLPGTPSRGAVLVFHDDTELRRLERLRQEFVANVSHELKTPLAIIKSCIETLIDGGVDDPECRDRFLQRVADQAERLHTLILDLLRLARVESATEAFTMEEHDLAELISKCLERRRTLADGNRQTLRSVIPDDMGPALIWVDDEAVEQILDNLVDNALKYTPEGGTVEVRLRREADQVVLEVRDTGIGIAEADLSRIFERFYRVDKARSRELGGTGLGLSIVKHLVQAMQGTITAQSVVGQGSIFTIRFPALVAQGLPR